MSPAPASRASRICFGWWDENGLDHERVGETIERVGMKQFLEAVGIEANIDMIVRPRDNPYYKKQYDSTV